MKAFEILWIVLFRFRPLARLWAVALILVNLGSLWFLDKIYGQVNLVAVLFGFGVMIPLYYQLGFVRLLGIGHILWIPMLIYFFFTLPDPVQTPALYWWVVILMIFNGISLVIDSLDVIRFFKGERAPYYVWHKTTDLN